MSDQLTVKELKHLLDEMDEDLIVITEGCDCFGVANGVSVGDEWVLGEPETQTYVIIGRKE